MVLRRSAALVAVALVVGLVISACGSSSKKSAKTSSSSGASTSTGGGGATPKATSGSPIRIGVVCSCSGVAGSSSVGAAQVAVAWRDATNATGGINGHPVKVIELDDASNPPMAVQEVKRLVQQDHVQAIVNESLDETAWESYVQQRSVPVFGGLDITPPWTTSQDFFPAVGTNGAVFFGVLEHAVAAGKTKVGLVYCVESPACSLANEKVFAPDAGAKIVYSAGVSSTAPSYISQCLAAKSAGVQAVVVGVPDSVLSRLITDCTQQGFTPLFLGPGGEVGPVTRTNPDATHVYETLYAPPVSSTSAPGMQQYHAAMAKYEPGTKAVGDIVTDLWAGLDMVKVVGKLGHITAQTSAADVRNDAYLVKNQTLDGLSPVPITYVKGKTNHVLGWFGATIKGGQVVQSQATGESVPAKSAAAVTGVESKG